MKIIFITILAVLIYVVGINAETVKFFESDNANAISVQKTTIDPSPVSKPRTEPLTASPMPSTGVKHEDNDINVAISTPVIAPDNETSTWNFLIAQGFSREQTAGIMGNLMQEHHFRTDGDGLAQWVGTRKANLMARENPYDLHVQLNFLMEELNGGYAYAKQGILASSIVDATLIFQNQFERCGYCMQGQRVQYAYDILGRH